MRVWITTRSEEEFSITRVMYILVYYNLFFDKNMNVN